MSKPELNTDLFDRYLHNELNAAELAEFEENLLNDNAFNADFIAYKTIALGIKDYGKAELKDYIKLHGKVTVKGGNFKISRMVFALAASLIIIAGLYIVTTYYAGPGKVLNIATSEEIRKEKEEIVTDTFAIAENDAIKQDKQRSPAPVIVSETEVPPSAEKEEDMAVIEPQLADGLAGAGEVERSGKQQNKYNVLSDMKVSDTLLFAMTFYDDDEVISKNRSQNKEKDSKKAITGTNNGKYSNRNEPKYSTDSVITHKKTSLSNPDKYTIEFWLSPVNFKGYKMVEKTIQLFGYPGKNTKLMNYNKQLYLTNGINVFVLTPCPDGCTYKTESDEEIVKLILSH